MNSIAQLIDYAAGNHTEILNLIQEHILLVGLSSVIALLLGLPIGIGLTFNKALADTFLQLANIIMTIPSIALFGLMMPLLSVINQGIGFTPALIALVLYSQMPIMRNTYTAISSISPSVNDAAKGMGMNKWEQLRYVQIPIAWPIILAGVRTAVVMNIGIGAIAAFVGAGGLGVLINQGIARTHTEMILTGAISIGILALLADGMLSLLQKKSTSKHMRVK
ncbi:ABC transporter permease [Bacillus sp. FSL H8-0547]